MNKTVLSITHWYFDTVKKFFKKTPWTATKVVVISIFAQIALMLGSLLPLKVVILLGSPHIPGYFPESLRVIERDYLIIGLSTASVLFLLFYVISQKLIAFYVDKCSKFLLEKNKKIVLYRNQSDVAKKAYDSFLRSVTGMVFLVIAFLLIEVLYPNLLLFILVYMTIASIVLISLNEFNELFRLKLEQNLTVILRAVSMIGFFSAFSFIVTDFLLPIEPPGLIYALLGIILTRQVLSISTSSIQSVASQYNNRSKINALFFQGYHISDEIDKKEKLFWSLLEPSKRIKWLTVVLEDVVGLRTKKIEADWYQTGVKNVVTLEVKAHSEYDSGFKRFFIKLFNKNQSSMALNDISLLQSSDLGFVTLNFIGATEVEQYHCHIFEWGKTTKLIPIEFVPKKLELIKTLMSYEPPKNFLDRYTRSHPLLGQRLNNDMIERLEVVANESEFKQLGLFKENFDKIVNLLCTLPSQLVFSKISLDAVVNDEGNNLKVLSWGGWSFEPLGFGWPIEAEGINDLINVLVEIKDQRRNFKTIPDDAVVLSAIMSNFEKSYNKQDFVRAIKLLPLILDCLDRQDIIASSPFKITHEP